MARTAAETSLVISALAFFSALTLGLALMPTLIRHAPWMGMMDMPQARKVHVNPTPRVGGIAVVIATIVPCLVLLPLDQSAMGFALAASLLFIVGVVDDKREIGPMAKFSGQILSASIVVYVGGVYVNTLPFMGLDPLAPWVAKPFTVFAMVGMMNAVNVTDGLDGLAGGLSLLSLAGFSYFASRADNAFALTLALATAGAVVAFLRYNTRPAIVFMGDTGSQFLGFVVGFLAVYITQRVNPALSPALPLLLLGVPIIDIFSAVAQRLRAGIGPFVASRHHIHHRLLDAGLDSHQAVVLIYTVQAFLVASAVLLAYEADFLVVFVFMGASLFILGGIAIRFRSCPGMRRAARPSRLTNVVLRLRNHSVLTVVPFNVVFVSAATYLIVTACVARHVPSDIALAAALLAGLLTMHMLLSRAPDAFLPRLVVFVAVAFAAYLGTSQAPRVPFLSHSETVFFLLLAAFIALSLRFGSSSEFRTTPFDYLVVFLILGAGLVSQNAYLPERTASIVIKAVILFYATELIMAHTIRRRKVLYATAAGALTVMAFRGLIAG